MVHPKCAHYRVVLKQVFTSYFITCINTLDTKVNQVVRYLEYRMSNVHIVFNSSEIVQYVSVVYLKVRFINIQIFNYASFSKSSKMRRWPFVFQQSDFLSINQNEKEKYFLRCRENENGLCLILEPIL